MWLVAKINIQEVGIFKKKLIEKFGQEIEFYNPKIVYYKNFKNKIKKYEKFILENYIFCHHKKFVNSKVVNEVKFVKGLQYFLTGYVQNQDEIIGFIRNCQSFENKDGYITQAFFRKIVANKAKFISGPFANMMFEIIEKQKNKLKISINNIVMTISNNQNYLYRSV